MDIITYALLSGMVGSSQASIANLQEELASTQDALQETRLVVQGLENGLASAAHFCGVFGEMPEKRKDGSDFMDGDIVVVDSKEYIFNGVDFSELGDEDSINESDINALF